MQIAFADRSILALAAVAAVVVDKAAGDVLADRILSVSGRSVLVGRFAAMKQFYGFGAILDFFGVYPNLSKCIPVDQLILTVVSYKWYHKLRHS